VSCKFDYSFYYFRIYTFVFVTQLISIIMPVKNAALFLDECIDSIISQSYSNWELLAVNDNSDDDTPQILKRFSALDARITVLNNHSKGIIEALKTGYNISKGEFITRMDADDIMPKIKLEKLQQLLIRSGKGFVASGLVKYFSEKPLGNGYIKYEQWLNGLSSRNSNYSEIYKECTIPSPCWMMWKEDFELCGGFNSNTYPEDYDLAFRMYQNKMDPTCSKEILHLWRDSENRASRTDDNYKDNRFIPLKVKYFIDIDYHPNNQLYLWGASKKGKEIAQALLKTNTPFRWLCNSQSKIGHNIYEIIMEDCGTVKLNDSQIIIAVANESDQKEILKFILKFNNADYFHFC
jgi:glycosyltransferase involved in cell wall biosynthesis